MSIGILVALPEELSTLTPLKLVQGDCVNIADNILLAFAGAGPANAERATHLLIANGAKKLISWGCAAALSPQLKPGDLMLAEQLLSEQQQVFDTDPRWRKRLHELLDKQFYVSNGKLAESSHIVSNSSDKHNIYRQTGAIALDMESCAMAKVAGQSNLPCLAIRTIADPVSMSLPEAVTQALNGHGQIEISKLLCFLATHPWEAPNLIKLGLHFHAAQKTLRIIAKQLNEIIVF
ncbi:Adenosylhopane nucleosidase, HpnG [Methylomonas albis]|uniref:Phosphorylase n=1 Tax=Methylomonas albis TaxID=1854563 RepID=A0ABR9CWR1_9GAMM|nr:phosphorylase [Methylomonas albis]MBD9355155.1 phosphorylase [Methylomonas albis]CAD6878093.1 Adenosylhopane nucleosidase, HpnG [Methylomonas albis]